MPQADFEDSVSCLNTGQLQGGFAEFGLFSERQRGDHPVVCARPALHAPGRLGFGRLWVKMVIMTNFLKI